MTDKPVVLLGVHSWHGTFADLRERQPKLRYVGGVKKVASAQQGRGAAAPLAYSASFSLPARGVPINYLPVPYTERLPERGVSNEATRIELEDGTRWDVPHGRGALYHGPRPVYHGQWRDGFRHGYGEAPMFDMARTHFGVYRGAWAFGLRHGFGELQPPTPGSAPTYVGCWARDMREGVGKLVHADGSYLLATFARDVPCGAARFYWASGGVDEQLYDDAGRLVSHRQLPAAAAAAAASDDTAQYALAAAWRKAKVAADAAAAAVGAPLPLQPSWFESVEGMSGGGGGGGAGGGGALALLDAADFSGPAALKQKLAFRDFCAGKDGKGVAHWQQRVTALLGGADTLPISIDQPSFLQAKNSAMALHIAAAGDSAGCLQPLVAAIEQVAADAEGLDAVRTRVKGITIRNNLHEAETSFTLGDDGTLVVESAFELGSSARIVMSKAVAFLESCL